MGKAYCVHLLVPPFSHLSNKCTLFNSSLKGMRLICKYPDLDEILPYLFNNDLLNSDLMPGSMLGPQRLVINGSNHLVTKEPHLELFG